MRINKLQELAGKYSLSDEIVEQREKDRLSFIEKFPLNKLKDLPIDQFVQGTDDNSFCFWLEFKKIGFGIGGGNASNFGIYKTKNNKEIAEKKPFRDEKFKALNCQVAFTDLFNDEGKLEKDLGKRIYNELLKKEIKTGANNVYSA